MKKILLTGFEAFNGREINPSSMIVDRIKAPQNVTLLKHILPVEFKRTAEILTELVKEEMPDIILSIGQAGNVPHISIERIAVNIDNCLASDGKNILPDASGDSPIDRQIFRDGENAYFATIPVWELIRKVNDENILCRVSYSAGTYVCNHVMYVGAYLASKNIHMSSGFIHVPFLPEQLEDEVDTTGKYSMGLDDMVKGIQTIIDYLS